MPRRSRAVELRLTPAQLDALISVVEMTLEGSGATFGDWLDVNGSHDLLVVERQLREVEGDLDGL